MAACQIQSSANPKIARQSEADQSLLQAIWLDATRWRQTGKEYDLEVRALKVSRDTGKCAVLYLDSIDNRGQLFMYAFGPGEYPACCDIQGSLDRCQSHQKVKDKAKELCASR